VSVESSKFTGREEPEKVLILGVDRIYTIEEGGALLRSWSERRPASAQVSQGDGQKDSRGVETAALDGLEVHHL
jgi:hypothetical protein